MIATAPADLLAEHNGSTTRNRRTPSPALQAKGVFRSEMHTTAVVGKVNLFGMIAGRGTETVLHPAMHNAHLTIEDGQMCQPRNTRIPVPRTEIEGGQMCRLRSTRTPVALTELSAAKCPRRRQLAARNRHAQGGTKRTPQV